MTTWYSKLTEAERQIWYLLYYHPTHILNRTMALDLLFCVIGTGIEWNDKGEIIDPIDDNYLSKKKQEIHNLEAAIYKKALINSLMPKDLFRDRIRAWDIRIMKEYNFHQHCIAEYTLKNIEQLVTTTIVPKSFLPLGAHSNLMTVPENVRADWLDLAIETCDLILLTSPLHRDSDNRLVNRVNLKLAKKQRIKLLKIKKQRIKDKKK